MADNAEYISLMNTALPTNRDPRADGAAEIRAVKTAIKNCFPELDGEVAGDSVKINNGIRSQYVVGMIMPWWGVVENIPDGWALCDGSIVNNEPTPDLRGKYLVGAAKDAVHNEEVGIDNPNIGDTYEITPYALKPENIPELEIGLYTPDGTEQPLYDSSANDGNSRRTYGNDPWGEQGKMTLKTKGTPKDGAVAHKHDISAKVNEKNEAAVFDNRPASLTIHWIMFVGYSTTLGV